MTALLIKNGTVVTLGEKNRVLQDGAVLIEDGVIKAVGKTATVKMKARGAETINARNKVVMPGFINAHMHLYSTFARGLSPKQPPPANFTQILEKLWWPLDNALNADDLQYSALVPLIDCVKSGTTTIIDHHESQGFQEGALDVLEKALRRVGVRGCLSLGVSDRYGKGEEGLRENTRFIEHLSWKRKRGNDLVAGMFGLHALFTVQQKTLKACIAQARDMDVGVHVHTAEAEADQKKNLSRYKKRVIERLYDVGGLGPRTLAIHCVHVNAREMDLLARTNTPVVHNPQSNMNNAVGVAPVQRMLDKGVVVGLGTDGMTANVREAAPVANILHKLNAGDPRVFFMEACQLLLENNAKIVSRLYQRPVGVLKKGAYGDVIVLDYDPPTPLTAATFAGHFLFGLYGARVDTTVVNGKVLMQDGQLKGINEHRIMEASRKQAKNFWKRF
jgi:putative selenium metabolism protein SsnA